MENKDLEKENRVLDWDDEIEDLSQEESEARYGKASSYLETGSQNK